MRGAFAAWQWSMRTDYPKVKTLELASAEPLLVRDRADSRRIWQAIARGGLRGDPGGREAIGPR